MVDIPFLILFSTPFKAIHQVLNTQGLQVVVQVDRTLSLQLLVVFNHTLVCLLYPVDDDEHSDGVRVHAVRHHILDVLAYAREGAFKHFFVFAVHADTDGQLDGPVPFHQGYNVV